ncbi:polyphosphate kinase 2 [Catenovulum sediminis]|uniref:polyphosphate kinase 2 n=1 Tax=Catenovulum sediminis TaxID=1740262 RepID=UPI0011808839|nr:polyphosphate kinase 2 [Catenovulum sediminis]
MAADKSNNSLTKKEYKAQLKQLQTELVKLQYWVQKKGLKVVILFEGRDAAGKGSMIKAISERLNPRHVKTVALGKPSDREKTQWYFQRYVQHLPAAGEICLFDRSWYNRAGVEHVMGFCSKSEYQEFLTNCPKFESMLKDSGIILLKYWLSVSPQEQEKRFEQRLTNPLKRWKFSDMDLEGRERWADYSKAKMAMMQATDTKENPWYRVEADNKKLAKLNCIHHILSHFEYRSVSFPNVELPAVTSTGYELEEHDTNNLIAKIY